jgi:hypothetical protein
MLASDLLLGGRRHAAAAGDRRSATGGERRSGASIRAATREEEAWERLGKDPDLIRKSKLSIRGKHVIGCCFGRCRKNAPRLTFVDGESSSDCTSGILDEDLGFKSHLQGLAPDFGIQLFTPLHPSSHGSRLLSLVSKFCYTLMN